MKCTLLFAIIATTVAYVNAVFITQPIQSTQWQFGKKQTVTWDAKGESGSKEIYLFYTNGVDPSIDKGENVVAQGTIPDVSTGSYQLDLVSNK